MEIVRELTSQLPGIFPELYWEFISLTLFCPDVKTYTRLG